MKHLLHIIRLGLTGPIEGLKGPITVGGVLIKGSKVDFITPQLAVGGRARSRRLRESGITHILNVRVKADRVYPDVVAFHHPTVDDGASKDHAYWIKSIELARPILADPDAKLYVHCKAGVNRSAGAAYAILRSLGHSPGDAWTMVKTARPKVRPRYIQDIEDALTH